MNSREKRYLNEKKIIKSLARIGVGYKRVKFKLPIKPLELEKGTYSAIPNFALRQCGQYYTTKKWPTSEYYIFFSAVKNRTMTDRITPEGICETCGKVLSEFELYHEICVSCGGYPICQNCSGNGCPQCHYKGEVHPEKINQDI